MTSNKRLRLENYSEVRQSFGGRICDDLSEVILQYLPLEDKLAFECVSKQFQRTIYKRHYELSISNETFLNEVLTNLFEGKSFNLNRFETLLKKCPNITTIVVYLSSFCCADDDDSIFNNYNEFIELITRYCHNLVRFECPVTDISVSAFDEFQRKFGSKIISFDFIGSDAVLKRLSQFPNVEELQFQWTDHLDDISGINFEKLKKLQMKSDFSIRGINSQQEYTRKLVTHFKHLQHLDLDLGHVKDDEIIDILLDISKLKQLIHLGFDESFPLNDSLKQLSNIGDQLKSIGCCLDVDEDEANPFSRVPQIMAPLMAFKGLKRLKLRLRYDFDYDSDETLDLNEILSSKIFKGFSNITHLNVRFGLQSKNWKIMKDIDIHLPNLQFLKIENELEIEEKSVEELTDILSRLSKLETIKLCFDNELICEQIQTKIAEKCRKIKSIEIQKELE